MQAGISAKTAYFNKTVTNGVDPAGLPLLKRIDRWFVKMEAIHDSVTSNLLGQLSTHMAVLRNKYGNERHLTRFDMAVSKNSTKFS